MTSTPRTARCGPACRVVWQGSSEIIRGPYADREFLSVFENEPASTEVAFYYAECLWQIAAQSSSDTSSWSSAAEQYTRVIRLDDRSPYVKEAAYAAVLAWQNALYDNSAGPPERGASHPLRLERQ